MKTRTSSARLRLVFAALLTFLLIHSLNAHARIGETIAQCDARYGGTLKVLKNGLHLYQKPPMDIRCIFSGGVCEVLMVSHIETDALNSPTELSGVEIEAIMEANSGGRTWVKDEAFSMNSQWHTTDGFLLASYRTFDHHLMIMTKPALDRANAEKAADEKAKLKGF